MDVRGKWPAIEERWLEIIKKQAGDDSIQWIDPDEHLSYQMPAKPFEICEEDFQKVAMDYIMFQNGIDAREFGDELLDTVLYGSEIEVSDSIVTISVGRGEDNA